MVIGRQPAEVGKQSRAIVTYHLKFGEKCHRKFGVMESDISDILTFWCERLHAEAHWNGSPGVRYCKKQDDEPELKIISKIRHR